MSLASQVLSHCVPSGALTTAGNCQGFGTWALLSALSALSAFEVRRWRQFDIHDMGIANIQQYSTSRIASFFFIVLHAVRLWSVSWGGSFMQWSVQAVCTQQAQKGHSHPRWFAFTTRSRKHIGNSESFAHTVGSCVRLRTWRASFRKSDQRFRKPGGQHKDLGGHKRFGNSRHMICDRMWG